VGKGGIVRDPAQHEQVLNELGRFAAELGYEVAGQIPSPLLGAKGNREFLMYLRRNG
jgi:23S rRNA (cytidine1920-2'-O)/16S rRNA (cytidine1409-2'-O)-methyltransferase